MVYAWKKGASVSPEIGGARGDLPPLQALSELYPVEFIEVGPPVGGQADALLVLDGNIGARNGCGRRRVAFFCGCRGRRRHCRGCEWRGVLWQFDAFWTSICGVK